MPLTDGTSVPVGAAATSNLFSGRPIEFIGQPSTVRLFLAADAASVTAQVLVNVGGQQMAPVASGMTVNVASAAGAGPKEDEDRIAEFGVPPGARLQLNATNGGGAGTAVRYRAMIAP